VGVLQSFGTSQSASRRKNAAYQRHRFRIPVCNDRHRPQRRHPACQSGIYQADRLQCTGSAWPDAHLLSSGRTTRHSFQAMWSSLKKTGYWQGEIWNRRKNGMIVAEWLTIAAVTAPDGSITHYVGTFSDITRTRMRWPKSTPGLLRSAYPFTQPPPTARSAGPDIGRCDSQPVIWRNPVSGP